MTTPTFGAAIVGIGCRLPGAVSSTADFWRLLCDRIDAIGEIPASRFDIDRFYHPTPGTPGCIVSRWGGFVDGIDEFDAEFFGISPREAQLMDPQQRLALEAAWEAFEDAGIVPQGLADRSVGVFIGAIASEYQELLGQHDETLDVYAVTGGARNAIAGRISHLLGLGGPSVVVDTDRSSSLVAVHLAYQSLRSGECEVALAGGTNLILKPETSIAFSRAGMLAPDGRCKFADAGANGFVRSEGIGVVVLKPLDAAVAAGDPIYAVIHGGATANAGATGDIMTPSRDAQRRLLRRAFEDAGISPEKVGYIEAHGPGTPAGDPVELTAIGEAMRGRSRPCLTGSVKTNIGHAEAAAGVVGLIKTALALKHQQIPASLHCDTLHPGVDFDALPVGVATEATVWPADAPFAGVSSFGLTGTNAHLVLGPPPGAQRAASVGAERAALILPLSAGSSRALRSVSDRLGLLEVGDGGPSAADLCYSAAVHRSHHRYRRAVVGESWRELAAQLSEPLPALAAAGPRRVAFVYSGQGSQWATMGADLAAEPAYREALAAVDAALRPHCGWSVVDALNATAEESRVDTNEVMQPAIFAVQLAITRVFASWGVEPALVVGHSMGEVAAAHVAGALTLERAARLIVSRSRLMARQSGKGGMLFVALPKERVVSSLVDPDEELDLATINGPSATVVSGSLAALERATTKAAEEGAFVARVRTDIACHSYQMDPVAGELRQELADLAPSEATLPLYSTVRATRIDGERLTGEYWADNVRQAVRFAPTVRRMLDDGADTFVEIAPHAVLAEAIRGTIAGADVEARVVPTLRRQKPGQRCLLESIAGLYQLGVEVDWSALQAGRFTPLPTYTWDRRRFWYDSRVLDGRVERRVPLPSWREPAEDPQQPPEEDERQLSRADMLAIVRRETAKVLGFPAEQEIDPQRPFRELGLKSAMTLELQVALRQLLGRDLSATDFYNHPTIGALTEHLLGSDSAPVVAPRRSAPRKALPREDAVAIVGVGCRFPGGVESLEGYRALLMHGFDAIDEVPSERWSADRYFDADASIPGKTYARWGSFIKEAAAFDARFFGVTPREAESIDPQQRLLLETSWQALEHANIRPSRVAGSRSGVFVGMMNNAEYASLQLLGGGLRAIESHYSSGNANSVAAGRLSYYLDIHGPCVTVDTACSSSLVALHLACQSLRSGESELALAGGVNLTLSPAMTVAFSKTRMLSRDGRCKTFDASGDGYVRGEGCVILVLKRLTEARRDGDDVIAIVRATAINQDGRSSGVTAPNGTAQVMVLRDALDAGRVDADQVGYVEAHGTGTSLGDPIELQSLGTVYSGQRRTPVGSAKTNVGHLEAAAGVAGLLKAVIAMRSETIPPHINLRKVNPHVPFERLPLAVPTASTPWIDDGPLLAATSSFGFSGTNSHVLVESVRPRPAGAVERLDWMILPISARDEGAFRQLTGRYAALLESAEATPEDICFTAGVGRDHFAFRSAFVGDTREALRTALGADAAPRKCKQAPRIAFIYSGQGSQYVGMGRDLYDAFPRFRASLDRCAALLAGELDVDLLELLYPSGEADAARVDRTCYTQPALFALGVALTDLWRSWGVEPEVVLGHSVGEVVAAWAAGVFGLEDGLRLICERARLMDSVTSDGAMAAVFADEATAIGAIRGYGDDVCIAALNAPTQTVISGARAAVEAAVEQLKQQGVRSVPLRVSQAFHSSLMDPILEAFSSHLSQLSFARPQVPLVSNGTGVFADGAIAEAGYWAKHIRQPVRLVDSYRYVAADVDAFVEIGPAPVLIGNGRRCLPEFAGAWLPSLTKERNGVRQILESLAGLYRIGCDVDWNEVDPRSTRRRVSLPSYAFQRERFWAETASAARPPAVLRDDSDPLVGRRILSPGVEDAVFEATYTDNAGSFLADHRVYGPVVVPYATHLSRILATASSWAEPAYELTDLRVPEPLVLEPGMERRVQLIVKQEREDRYGLRIYSADVAAAPPQWQLHLAGKLAIVGADERAVVKSAITERLRGAQELSTVTTPDAFYLERLTRGIDLGPTFRWIDSMRSAGGVALADLHPTIGAEAPQQHVLHPGVADSMFQVLTAAALSNVVDLSQVENEIHVPISIRRFTFFAAPKGCCRIVAFTSSSAEGLTIDGDVYLLDEEGEPVAFAEEIRLKRASRQAFFRHVHTATRDYNYELEWTPAPPPQASGAAGRWLLFADEGGFAARLGAVLCERGAEVTLVQRSVDGQVDLEGVLGGDQDLAGVAYLWGLDLEARAEQHEDPHRWFDLQGEAVAPLLELMKAAALMKGSSGARVWALTRGCGACGAVVPTPRQALQASIAGLGRVFANEHAARWGGLIDLDPRGGDEAAQLVADRLLAGAGEPEVCLRGSEALAPRLVKAPRPERTLRFDTEGTYLVTGGLGALGLKLARWLAERDAGHIVLIGRSEPSSDALKQTAALEKDGARILVGRADVGKLGELETLLQLLEGRPPVRGIIHAAGVNRDASLLQQSWENFPPVLAPKVVGALHLLQLVERFQLQLDFFALFSSFASLFGNPGQANYAAANAFLDSVAHAARALGVPTVSVNWGPWQDGMAAGMEDYFLSRWGLNSLSGDEGLEFLERAIANDVVQSAALPVSASDFHARFGDTSETPAILRQVGGGPEVAASVRRDSAAAKAPEAQSGSDNGEHRDLGGAAMSADQLVTHVTQLTRRLLRYRDAQQFPTDEPLDMLGVDSLLALDLIKELESSLGLTLPPTLIFEYPTINDIAAFLETELAS